MSEQNKKYIIIIGDGMADEPVEELGNITPLQKAHIPTIDRLAMAGTCGSVINCPPPLPAGSETAILSIFGCDPIKYFTGRSPMEAAALGLELKADDVCFRANLVTLEQNELPFEQKRILSHSAGSIAGQYAIDTVNALNENKEFAAALKRLNMALPPVPNFRPLLIEHGGDFSGVSFAPPHDHLGETIGPILPHGSKKAETYLDLMRLANKVLENHPVTLKRRCEGKLGANGIWIWAAGKAAVLPSFYETYGIDGAVISAVPLCHGIGVLRGLDMVEVEGATGELDTNFEGKLEAAWQQINAHDFLCLHLEAPDECTHNGDLNGKLQAIEWLDSRIVDPLVKRLDEKGMHYRLLLLSDHKTLTSNRAHAGGTVPFLIYDSEITNGCGLPYNEESCEKGIFVKEGHTLMDMLIKPQP